MSMFGSFQEVLEIIELVRQRKARMQHLAAEEGNFLEGLKLQEQIQGIRDLADEVRWEMQKQQSAHERHYGDSTHGN